MDRISSKQHCLDLYSCGCCKPVDIHSVLFLCIPRGQCLARKDCIDFITAAYAFSDISKCTLCVFLQKYHESKASPSPRTHMHFLTSFLTISWIFSSISDLVWAKHHYEKYSIWCLLYLLSLQNSESMKRVLIKDSLRVVEDIALNLLIHSLSVKLQNGWNKTLRRLLRILLLVELIRLEMTVVVACVRGRTFTRTCSFERLLSPVLIQPHLHITSTSDFLCSHIYNSIQNELGVSKMHDVHTFYLE